MPDERGSCLACGAEAVAFDLRLFPLTWTGRCLDCGFTLRCTLKPPPKPNSPPPSYDDNWY